MSDDYRLGTVATFNSTAHAELAQAILADHGIRSFVAGGETGSALGGVAERVKLQVREADFVTAERLLNSHDSAANPQDDYGLARPTDAITSKPGQVREEPADVDDADDDEIENEQETMIDKAFRAAVFGLLLFPPLLHCYSLALLCEVGLNHDALGSRHRKFFWITAAVDVVAFLAGSAFWWMVFRGY